MDVEKNLRWLKQLCKVNMLKISSIHQIRKPKILFTRITLNISTRQIHLLLNIINIITLFINKFNSDAFCTCNEVDRYTHTHLNAC